MTAPIFAPNFNPLIPGNEMVIVFNYWDSDNLLLTENYGPFYPKGMSFTQTGIETEEGLTGGFTTPLFRLTPNSFIRKMTKNEYDRLVNTKKIEIAQFFIQNSEQNTDPFNPGRILVPSLPVVSFDDKSGIALIHHVINQIFGPNNNGPYSIFLPKMVPVVDNAGNITMQNDLYGTYCTYDTNNLNAACDKCLAYEAEFMSSFGLFVLGGSAAHRYSTRFFDHPELVKQKPKVTVRKTVPDCKLCKYYVVYCSSLELNAFDFIVGPPHEETIITKGLILSLLSGVSEDLPENAKFFETYEKAYDYYIDIIAKTPTKWICKEKLTMGMGTNITIEYECIEVLESCLFAYLEDGETIPVYDTKSECEENCGKKWYCLEYQCTLVDETSQLVDGMQGYDTQEECEQNCVIPTTEPITETPSPS